MALRKVNDSDRNTLLEVTEFNGMITAIDSSVIDNTYFKVANNVVFDNMGSVRKREGIKDYGVNTYGNPYRQINEFIYPYATDFNDISGGDYTDLDEDIIADGSYIGRDNFDGSNNYVTKSDDYSVLDLRNVNDMLVYGERYDLHTEQNNIRLVHGRDITYKINIPDFDNDILSLEFGQPFSLRLYPWYEPNFSVSLTTRDISFIRNKEINEIGGLLSVRKVVSIYSEPDYWTVLLFSGNRNNITGFFWALKINKSSKEIEFGMQNTFTGESMIRIFETQYSWNLIRVGNRIHLQSNDFLSEYPVLSISDSFNGAYLVDRLRNSESYPSGDTSQYGPLSTYIGMYKRNEVDYYLFAFGRQNEIVYSTLDQNNPEVKLFSDLVGDNTFPDIKREITEDDFIEHVWRNEVSGISDEYKTLPIFGKYSLNESGTPIEKVIDEDRVVTPYRGDFDETGILFCEGNNIIWEGTPTGYTYSGNIQVFSGQEQSWDNCRNTIWVKSTSDNIIRDLDFNILKTFDSGSRMYDNTRIWMWVETVNGAIILHDMGSLRDLVIDDVSNISMYNSRGVEFEKIGIFFSWEQNWVTYLDYDPDSDVEISVGVNSLRINVLSKDPISPVDYNSQPIADNKVQFQWMLSEDSGIIYLQSDSFKFSGTTDNKIILYDNTELESCLPEDVKYTNFGERNVVFVNGKVAKVLSFLENTAFNGQIEYYGVLDTYNNHADDRKNTFIEAQTFGYNLATENYLISIDPNKENSTLVTSVLLNTILNNVINPTSNDDVESTFVVDTISETIYEGAEIRREIYRKDGSGDYNKIDELSDGAYAKLDGNETINWGKLDPGNYLVKGFARELNETEETTSQVSFVVDDENDSDKYESVSKDINKSKEVSYTFGKLLLYSSDNPYIYTSNIGDPFYIASQNIANLDVYNKNERITKVFPYKDINLVFTDNTILALEGTGNLLGESPWRVTGLESNIGLVGPNAIDAIDNTLMFQSKNGLYIVEDVVVSEKRISLTELSFPIKEEASPYIEVSTDIHELITDVVVKNLEQRVYIVYPNRKNRMLVYDYALTEPAAGRFSIWESVLDIKDMYINHENKLILRGNKNPRKLYVKRDKVIGSIKERFFSNGFYTDDGEAITVNLETHDTTLGDSYTFNKPKKLWVSTTNNITNASSYNVSILLDNTEVFNDDISVSVYNRPQTGQMVSGNQYTGYKESNNVYAKTILKSKVGRNTKVFITHNRDEPFEVNDFTIEFTSSKRKNRGSTT